MWWLAFVPVIYHNCKTPISQSQDRAYCLMCLCAWPADYIRNLTDEEAEPRFFVEVKEDPKTERLVWIEKNGARYAGLITGAESFDVAGEVPGGGRWFAFEKLW